MKKPVACLFALCLSFFVVGAPASAGPVFTANFQVSLTQEYNYATGNDEPISIPSTFDVAVTIPTSLFSFDDGPVTTTYFGDLGQTALSFPIPQFVDAPLASQALQDLPAGIYTRAFSADYKQYFLNSFLVAGTAEIIDGQRSGDVSFSLNLRQYLPSKGGTETADRPFTVAGLIDFLQNSKANPSKYQSLFGFDYLDQFALDPTTGFQPTGGKGWAGNATFLSISSVPEPSAWLLMTGGLMIASLVFRRRSGRVFFGRPRWPFGVIKLRAPM